MHTRVVPEKDPVLTDDDSPVVTTEQAGGFVDDEVMSDHLYRFVKHREFDDLRTDMEY